MHIFDGAEGFLPELELDGGIELSEAGVEVVLKNFGVREVDRMLLMCVLCNVGKMESQSFAEAAEFDLALMFEAELERLLGNLLKSQ